MAFTIRNMFSPGPGAESAESARDLTGVLTSQGEGSPFSMADQGGGQRGGGSSGFASFAVPASPPVFKPIHEEAFRSGPLNQPTMGGHGPVTSPFSMGAAPALTVSDILPNLPPEVARANGAPPDHPVNIATDVVDAALSNGSCAVPLFEVFRVCPGLFQVPISPTDHRQVRLPQSKLTGMVPGRAPAPPAQSPMPAPSPFSMAGAGDAGGMPSPFAMAAPMASPSAIERDKPVSRPIGALPPKRPDGVPPPIPTQNDFSAPPALQLPNFAAPNGGESQAGAPAASPFQFSFGGNAGSPAPSPNPMPAGFGGTPGSPPFASSPFMVSSNFGAPGAESAPRAESSPPAPAPSPFASIFAESQAAQGAPPHQVGPRSGPLMSSTPGAPPSFGQGSPFLASPPAAQPPVNQTPPGGGFFGGLTTPPIVGDPSRSPSPFVSGQSAPPASRPLNPAVSPYTVTPAAPSSRPLMPPPVAAPAQDTVELSLASIVKGYSPTELGFDPNFIPAWIMTKVPSYLVKQQTGSGEVKVDLGVVIDGTEESFRPVIAHGKRDFRVKLPANDLFHALPQVGAAPQSSVESFIVKPAEQPPAPQPPAPVAAGPAPVAAGPAPIQPVGLQGTQNPFHFPGASRPLNPPVPQPEPAAPAAGGWQAAGSPSPLFEVGAAQRNQSRPLNPQSQLPMAPMPEIAPAAPPQPQTFGSRPLQPRPDASGFPSFGSLAQPAPSPVMPQTSLPPMSMNVTSGAGSKDQMVLRALLGSQGPFDRASVVKLIAQFPGVDCCVFVSGDQLAGHGNGSGPASDFQRQASDLARGLRALASAIGIGEAETLSVNSDTRLVTFSFQGQAALGILHSDREPPSGLREKISLICKELAAMQHG